MSSKPSRRLGWGLCAVLVLIWGIFRLALFQHFIISLSFLLPLFVCVWTRDKRALWLMAACFAVFTTVKIFWVLPEQALSTAADWANFFAMLASIGLGAAAIHAIIVLRERLESSLTLISSQNEELQAQAEELAQQNEELKAQSEELEQQNEELQAQSEEINGLNAELAQREKLLHSLLESARLLRGEREVMAQICAAALEMLGDPEDTAAVLEESGSSLLPVAFSGKEALDPGPYPLANSFAQLVMRQNKIAGLEDASLRPDLRILRPGGKDMRAVLAAPLRRSGRPVGIVGLYSPRPRQWTADQFRMVDWLAGQCSLVLETIHLQENLRQEHKLLEAKVAQRTAELQDQIAETAKAHEAKERLNAQFLQAQKLEAVGLLAGGIAHDFNNVVAAIVANNYFIIEGLEEKSPLREYTLEIQRSSEVAGSLTRQLLALTRRQILRVRVIDVNSVILNMTKLLRRLLGENIQLETQTQADLWPIKMDDSQLEQVILNLAVNARDAMPKGGKLVLKTGNLEAGSPLRLNERIELPPGRHVVIEVKDTGAGMETAVQARIFEPFFTTKEPGRGTGLGLATVQAIIRETGGLVAVESAPGQGTAFRLYLPCVEGGTKALLAGRVSRDVKGGPESVLVVEDNAGLKTIMKRAMELKGYCVTCLGSAEEALEHCAALPRPYEALVSDVVLPGLDGLELIKRLRSQWPRLKVVCISGYAGAATSADLPAQGAAFLEKPFAPDALLAALRRLLDEA